MVGRMMETSGRRFLGGVVGVINEVRVGGGGVMEVVCLV